jgi:hypothetical protein
MPDDDDDVVGEMLQGRFGDTESDETESESPESESAEAEASDSTEATAAAPTDASESGATETTASGSTGRTRDRTQYPMYLSEGHAQALNELFERFNAERVLEGEPKVEKNKHFNEAVAELVLENQDELLERVERQINERDNY